LLIIWKSWNNFFAFFYLFENQKYGTRVPYRYLFAKSFIKLLLKYLLLVFFKWSFLLVKKGKRIVKKSCNYGYTKPSEILKEKQEKKSFCNCEKWSINLQKPHLFNYLYTFVVQFLHLSPFQLWYNNKKNKLIIFQQFLIE